MDKQVLDFFENSVCDFHFGKLDIHNVASKFESVVVLLGGLYIEPEYRKWIADCIVHIRDFRSGGYGIRELAYVLLAVWYCYYPDDADTVMLRFVVGGAGCWSDIKRFLGVWRKLGYHTDSRNGGVIEGRVVSIMVDRLWSYYGGQKMLASVSRRYIARCEMSKANEALGYFVTTQVCSKIAEDECLKQYYGMGRSEVAGLAKWVPREKSPRYGWLYDQFVLAWGSKAGWRGERMDTWRRRFRKVLCRIGGDAAPSARHMAPKDLVRLAIQGRDNNLDQLWHECLDRFCDVCYLPYDTIPVVNVCDNELYTSPNNRIGKGNCIVRRSPHQTSNSTPIGRANLNVRMCSKLAYAILIAQRGTGRIMVGNGQWIVAEKSDNFSDIILRMRDVVRYCGLSKGMDMIREASETTGYENPRVLVI